MDWRVHSFPKQMNHSVGLCLGRVCKVSSWGITRTSGGQITFMSSWTHLSSIHTQGIKFMGVPKENVIGFNAQHDYCFSFVFSGLQRGGPLLSHLTHFIGQFFGLSRKKLQPERWFLMAFSFRGSLAGKRVKKFNRLTNMALFHILPFLRGTHHCWRQKWSSSIEVKHAIFLLPFLSCNPLLRSIEHQSYKYLFIFSFPWIERSVG